MIALQTTGRHYDLDAKILKYIDSKLGKLDRYLPRRSRGGLAGTVVLELDESLSGIAFRRRQDHARGRGRASSGTS